MQAIGVKGRENHKWGVMKRENDSSRHSSLWDSTHKPITISILMAMPIRTSPKS